MKPTVIDPKTTARAAAFDLWMNAPNPMVTFFKTLDVTPLVRISRKRGYKFNIASLLVHRQGGKRDRGVLSSSRGARALAI